SMIPSLDKELAAFKESVKTDASVQVVHRDGYSGGGGMGLLGLAAALGLLLGFRRSDHSD
ncbi:MAG: hypothetical protein R8K46_00640, partial [Mariprofundaceae bacterium]